MFESWFERWQTGRIGWHEPDGNASLQRYWTFTGKRVLVPLCGKSVDLLWLEEWGNAVVGVELSPIAVEAFFEENALDFSLTRGVLDRYTATGRDITIYCGNYFDLADEQFDAHFDRGAFIAVDPDMRQSYAAHTDSLLVDDAAQLVVTIEYDMEIAKGPPHSVDRVEVQRVWPQLECLEDREDIENAPPKFLEAGLKSLRAPGELTQ